MEQNHSPHALNFPNLCGIEIFHPKQARIHIAIEICQVHFEKITKNLLQVDSVVKDGQLAGGVPKVGLAFVKPLQPERLTKKMLS